MMTMNPQALRRFAMSGNRQFFDMGGDAPAPDPLIGQAAKGNVELGNRALDFYQEAYKNDIRPRQQQLDALTTQVTQQQIKDQAAASQFADEARNDYRQIYRPMEQRSAADAANYDSTENVNRRMGIASANVNQSFDQAQEASIRNLQRYGINPNSGAFAAINARLTGQRALADATSRTGAAFDTQDRAIALRAGTVATGRGLQNSAAQSMAGGNSAGASAVGGANATAGTGVSGLSVPGNGFSAGMQGYTNAGNLMNQQYQGQLNAWGQKQEANGAMMGSMASMAAAAMMASSKKLKDRNEELDPHTVLEKVRGLKIDGWSYKGDGQRHIGPYAEDMHQKFGVGDGVTIGAGDPGGIALSAVKALDADMQEIKAALGIQTQGGRPQQRGLRTQ